MMFVPVSSPNSDKGKLYWPANLVLKLCDIQLKSTPVQEKDGSNIFSLVNVM